MLVTAIDLSPEERDVWAIVVARCKQDFGVLVARNIDWRGLPFAVSDAYWIEFARKHPHANLETLADYCQKLQLPFRIMERHVEGFGFPVRLLENDSLGVEEPASEVGDIVYLTRVGFDDAVTQALVFAIDKPWRQGGGGRLLYLERGDSKWEIRGAVMGIDFD